MSDATTQSVPAIFDLDDLMARYRIGKTKATELVQQPSFVRSVVPGMHRYPAAAIAAYELAVGLAGTVAEPSEAPAPVIVTPPTPGRPGPKPKSTTPARRGV